MSATRATTAVDTVQGAIVFTDLAGFTEFTAVQGDEAALELLSIQERLINLEMGEHGHIVKELGDGLMLWFGEACDAVRCSLAFQDEFERRSSAQNTWRRRARCSSPRQRRCKSATSSPTSPSRRSGRS